MARRAPLLSSQPLPTTLFSKFDAGAPTLGLQATQQAFNKIIRYVKAQARHDPELQEAARLNALLDENNTGVFKKTLASKKTQHFCSSYLRSCRRKEDQ